ncbi:MAG: 50S ribosomal protein L20 [Puniceicoccales bacterium]|jgi:large subunit ribosomal protein L20|nr:50S ribosomal protein L20 [Puniceicoccales bacterium]
MPRVTNIVATKKRRNRVLATTRGYFGNKSRLFRYAKDAMWRAGKFAYRDRKRKKTEMRQLWIVRINAACRANDISYSRFIDGLKKLGIEMNRKSLSELAIHGEEAFREMVAKARSALQVKNPPAA